MNRLLLVFGMLILVLTSNIVIAQTGWVQQVNPLGEGDTAMVGKVQFVSSTEGWISGEGGNLLHTTNAGVNWNVVTPFPNDTVFSFADPSFNMCFINSTTGWIMKTPGHDFSDAHGAIIYKTTDGGNSWEKIVLSQDAGVIGAQVQFVDALNGWASIFSFQETGYLYRTIDGGDIWNLVGTLGITDETSMFYFVDTNIGWMTYINDSPTLFKIEKTTDGGSTWNLQYSDNTVNGDTLHSSGAMQFTDSNNGWVVGPNGRILKTTNGGTNWELLTNSGLSIYASSKCLFFLTPSIGWIGTGIHVPNQPSFHIVIHTTDGGNSWTQESLPTWLSDNSIFSIFFINEQNGWMIGDYGVIGKYTGITGVEDNRNIPVEFSLSQNYPNPFNPSTKIQYSISSQQNVTLKVYNILGKEVATLVNEEKPAGTYEVFFNGSNLSSGIYFYKLQSGSFVETRKLTLLK